MFERETRCSRLFLDSLQSGREVVEFYKHG